MWELLQFLMYSVEFCGEGASDICILGIEGFLESLFGVTQRLCFSLVGLDVGGEVVELFLFEGMGTSTVDKRFFSDINYIRIIVMQEDCGGWRKK